MSIKRLAGFVAGLMLSTASLGAMAADLVIYHSWSAPPEIAALNVIKSCIKAKGHNWTDFAIRMIRAPTSA